MSRSYLKRYWELYWEAILTAFAQYIDNQPPSLEGS